MAISVRDHFYTLHRVKKYKRAISKYNLIFTLDQVFPLEVLLKA